MSSTSPQAAANIAPRYAPRDRTTSVLRDVVRTHLRALLEAGQDLDTGASHVPAFVQRELEAYLACGDPAQGALRLVCVACRHTVFVPFTCRGRSFCPSCGARRMVELTEHLLDHVLPDQPLRQFVASLPFALRPIVGYHPPAFAAFARIFASEVARLQRRQARARGVRAPPSQKKWTDAS